MTIEFGFSLTGRGALADRRRSPGWPSAPRRSGTTPCSSPTGCSSPWPAPRPTPIPRRAPFRWARRAVARGADGRDLSRDRDPAHPGRPERPGDPVSEPRLHGTSTGHRGLPVGWARDPWRRHRLVAGGVRRARRPVRGSRRPHPRGPSAHAGNLDQTPRRVPGPLLAGARGGRRAAAAGPAAPHSDLDPRAQRRRASTRRGNRRRVAPARLASARGPSPRRCPSAPAGWPTLRPPRAGTRRTSSSHSRRPSRSARTPGATVRRSPAHPASRGGSPGLRRGRRPAFRPGLRRADPARDAGGDGAPRRRRPPPRRRGMTPVRPGDRRRAGHRRAPIRPARRRSCPRGARRGP